ncbi:MAG: hypothetical protein H7Y17_08985 [Chlorobia bacterium]|nr:hypothetical protein [Fimbriimonadaceae bacterium]
MKKLFLLVVAVLFVSLVQAHSDDEPIVLKASTVTGTWMLNGSVRAVRFDLKQNGTFEYRGYGSQSKGRWNVEGSQVRLRWTEIDSSPVDAQSVTSLYSLEAGGLRIGKFEYRKNAAR